MVDLFIWFILFTWFELPTIHKFLVFQPLNTLKTF